MNTSDFNLRRHWKIIAAVVVVSSLLAWGCFHPPFRPDASTIAPALLAGLAKTGFASTRGVTAARWETVDSVDGLPETWTVEQKMEPIDGLLTEKRTRGDTKGLSDEASGLFVGPIAVVRYHRNRLPFVADLLPYQFWGSSRLSDFIVEEVDNFPHMKGGRLRAAVTYEEHYAGGELAQSERRQLRCEVASIVDASSINPALRGKAARIECHEELEPNGRQWGATNPRTHSVGRISYSHWYVLNSGWSVPIEGDSAFRLGDTEVSRRWNTKLVSFESRGP